MEPRGSRDPNSRYIGLFFKLETFLLRVRGRPRPQERFADADSAKLRAISADIKTKKILIKKKISEKKISILTMKIAD